MTATMTSRSLRGMQRSLPVPDPLRLDPWLLLAAATLLALGWVMVGSASITIADRKFGQPLYFLIRQSIFLGIGLAAAWMVFRTPLEVWRRSAAALLLLGVVLLVLVLIPGVGREVNGSMRWLRIGPMGVQPSEFIKLFMVLFIAGYLVRRGDELRERFSGFVKPLLIVGGIGVLLLLEPDFGATGVLMVTVVGMLFLGGVKFWQFLVLLVVGLAGAWYLVISSPYRLERLTTFLNPWADPFNSGFQLTQALIAFGRGEWFGVGLGGSVQKLFYLPEAHTDFLFAVLAEELGLVGALLVVALFSLLVWRTFAIAARSQRVGGLFGAYVGWGIGICLGLQALINIGVNMGALPTKGLTLPLMSYGGSSVIVACIMVALVLRVDLESREAEQAGLGEGGIWRAA